MMKNYDGGFDVVRCTSIDLSEEEIRSLQKPGNIEFVSWEEVEEKRKEFIKLMEATPPEQTYFHCVPMKREDFLKMYPEIQPIQGDKD